MMRHLKRHRGPADEQEVLDIRLTWTYIHLMIRPHKYSEPCFTMVEAAKAAGVSVDVLNQWLVRDLIKIGKKPPGMRRTLYSVADLVTIAVIGGLSGGLSMRPSFAKDFLASAQLRLAQVARVGFHPGEDEHLMGWQGGSDGPHVGTMVRMDQLDWSSFNFPVVVVPIDKIIKRMIEAGEKILSERGE